MAHAPCLSSEGKGILKRCRCSKEDAQKRKSALTMEMWYNEAEKKKKSIHTRQGARPQILDTPPFCATAILRLCASLKLYLAYVPMP